jgi:glycosyl transferase family 87
MDVATTDRASGWIGSLPSRTVVGAGVVLVAALDALLLVVLWPGVSGINDFVGLLAGGRAILAGVDPYDAARWTAFATAVGQPPETSVFGYPPWTALAFAPLALLPTPVASVVWTAGGLILATFACVALARHAGWPVVPAALLAAASWPAILVFLQGQWGYVLVAMSVAMLFAIEARRDGAAGVWWGLMVLAKPQLFVLGSLVLGAAALARGRARAVVAAVATVAAGAVAGTLAAPAWIGPYVAVVVAKRGARQTQEPTLAGLAGDVGGDLWPVVWTLAVVALGLAIAYAARSARSADQPRIFVAGTIALSVLAAPYSWSYDHYLAVPLAMAVLGIAARLDRRPRLALTLAVIVLFGPVAFALWESSYIRWHDTLAALVPVTEIVLTLVASRAARAAPSAP